MSPCAVTAKAFCCTPDFPCLEIQYRNFYEALLQKICAYQNALCIETFRTVVTKQTSSEKRYEVKRKTWTFFWFSSLWCILSTWLCKCKYKIYTWSVPLISSLAQSHLPEYSSPATNSTAPTTDSQTVCHQGSKQHPQTYPAVCTVPEAVRDIWPSVGALPPHPPQF